MLQRKHLLEHKCLFTNIIELGLTCSLNQKVHGVERIDAVFTNTDTEMLMYNDFIMQIKLYSIVLFCIVQ